MGLDISANSKLVLEKVLTREEYEDLDHLDDTVWDRIYIYPFDYDGDDSGEYALKLQPLVPGGLYRREGQEYGFRAGSYSGYNYWREQLSEKFIGVPPHRVWENPEAYRDKPFVELVNFSDCEGYIGSVTAEKLAKDFADHEDEAGTLEDEYFLDKYRQWRRAFEVASDDGMVDFH